MESKQGNRLPPRRAPVTKTIPEEQTARRCRAWALFDQPLAPRRVANRSDSRCVGRAALCQHSPTGGHQSPIAQFKPVGGPKRWEVFAIERRPRQAVWHKETCTVRAERPSSWEALWPTCSKGSGGQKAWRFQDIQWLLFISLVQIFPSHRAPKISR